MVLNARIRRQLKRGWKGEKKIGVNAVRAVSKWQLTDVDHRDRG